MENLDKFWALVEAVEQEKVDFLNREGIFPTHLHLHPEEHERFKDVCEGVIVFQYSVQGHVPSFCNLNIVVDCNASISGWAVL